MGLKVANAGYQTLPAAPTTGVSLGTVSAANTFQASYTELSSSAPAAIAIVGVHLYYTSGNTDTANKAIWIRLATGAAASEVVVSERVAQTVLVPSSSVQFNVSAYFDLSAAPVYVASGTRIAIKFASDGEGQHPTFKCILNYVNQADLVTDGIGGGATAAQVWDYLTSAIATSGSIGKLLKDDIDVILSSGIQARLPSALVSGRMDSSVGAVAANAIADAGLATDLDTYQAQIVLVKTALANHYTVIFYLNGQPITSGITSPTIQIIKASDGSDLVASTALTQIAATQTWKYDDSVNLVVAGSAYVAKVQATIDGSTRTWEQPVGASA